MTYATPADVQARLGRELTPEETALVDVRLADVERRIRRRIPDLDARVAANDLDADDVIQVEADSVLRLARNPEGYYSESDGNYAYTFDRSAASGRLEVTTEDWETLGVRASRMSVLAPSFGAR
ncbi:Gp19/Gp15/Gp42 family protein [Mycolicibacterium sp. Y3]